MREILTKDLAIAPYRCPACGAPPGTVCTLGPRAWGCHPDRHEALIREAARVEGRSWYKDAERRSKVGWWRNRPSGR
jgi:hypothetical protein